MKCSKLIESIESYLGGTMPPGRRKSFERHIAGCDRCRAELERCRQEDRLYRQALAAGRLQGTMRNTVLAQLKREHVSVRKESYTRRRASLWIIPVAAAAQFLIAFWLSATLMPRTLPAVPMEVASGRIVVVNWVRDSNRYRYFSIKRGGGMRGPRPAEKDVCVD